MMKHVLLLVMAVCMVAGAGRSAETIRVPGGGPSGKPVPYRVIPAQDFAAVVKNWPNVGDPHYAIIGNIGEWQSVFQATATMGNNRPFQPDPGLFAREVLVAISRVTDAPAPGETVLAVKSVVFADGELVLTYSFMPPPRKASYQAKSTLLVAIPAEFQDGLRIIEEIETPASMAAARELEAARAAGRVKQSAPGPMPLGAPAPVGTPAPRPAAPSPAPAPKR